MITWQKLAVVHHCDDIDAIWTYTVKDAIRAFENFTEVVALVFRNLASGVWGGTDILGTLDEPFDNLECTVGCVLRDVVVDES